MNLYILVEDGKSGHKIIGEWIGMLLPFMKRARDVASVRENSYIVFSGYGYPRILGTNPESPEKNVLGATIETINEKGCFDYFLIFLDGDGEDSQSRKDKVKQKIRNYRIPLAIPYYVFIQNICFESWLLGNQALYPIPYSKLFMPFGQHYNVKRLDPELMPNNPLAGTQTASLYHERYLRAMLKESGYHYNKSKPAPIVFSPGYLDQLKSRTAQSPHLKSLAIFFDFMEELARLAKSTENGRIPADTP
ncbi:MAG: hypothetical protein FWF59_15525 [Turicibacter sp.]|nr:hypothetical protein [Turicibacter sp.]